MTESTSKRTGCGPALGCAALLVLAVALFLGGIAFERYIGVRALAALNPIEALGAGGGEPASIDGLDAALLDEARRIIQQHFVDREDATDERLQVGALTGMVDALGDLGHSRFMTPVMVEEQANYTAGEFEGIGAYVEMRDGFVTIVTPMDGSPAQQAGVLPGDVVTHVNGEDVAGQTLQEVVGKILGPAGTEVTITFFRPDTNEELTFTLTRARIELENVTWAMIPGTTIGQVRVAAFSDDVGDELATAIAELEAQGATGIILDLRNNPGGLLTEAINVAGQFLPADTVVVLRQDAEDDITEERVPGDATPTDLPVVVLINQGSASASEIVSGAIQDHGRGTLVGETTFGTGTVLNQFGLSDGSAILLATEKWLTPDGRVIWRQGILPDEVVELTGPVTLLVPETAEDLTAEEVAATEDGQVKRAIELLESQ